MADRTPVSGRDNSAGAEDGPAGQEETARPPAPTESPLRAEALRLARAYTRERLQPHPLLGPCLADAALYVPGASVYAAADEGAPLCLHLLLANAAHAPLAVALRQSGQWRPEQDFRLLLVDREPFRRYPGAEVLVLSVSELARELEFDLPVTLWQLERAARAHDAGGYLADALAAGRAAFRSRLEALQMEHYYHFRRAREELLPRLAPPRAATVLAIHRGQAVREALRLAFLAEGRPYPPDLWLEHRAERETRRGAGIVDAVRALLAAGNSEAVAHTSKVLRDRVIQALQQGGVRERWLEQWWQWPAHAPAGVPADDPRPARG